MNAETLFPTVLIGVFIIIGIVIIGFGAYSLKRARAAEHWPTVQGAIVESRFETNSGDDTTTYRTHVRYNYSVGGVEYSSKRIAFGYAGSNNYQFHREIKDQLTEKTTLAVRYDPNNPSQATLSFGKNGMINFFIIFGVVWLVFSIGFGAMFHQTEQGAGNLLSNIIIYDHSAK